MQPPPSVALGVRHKAAIGAADNDGENMRLLTMNELMRMTRIELCNLLERIANVLRNCPVGSFEYHIAIMNLRSVCRILMQRDLSPA
jgi:hypothetical protein